MKREITTTTNKKSGNMCHFTKVPVVYMSPEQFNECINVHLNSKSKAMPKSKHNVEQHTY